MGDIPWATVLTIASAVLGILIPVGAFLWEFVFVGRKRLGYRVQVDTTAASEVTSQHAVGWQELLGQANGERLRDPSFVLVRIENKGTTNIDERDYSTLQDNPVGVRIRFPDRRVVAMTVTDLTGVDSHDFVPGPGFGVDNFEEEDSGLKHGEIRLPKVPLNEEHHYKVMAVLERGSPDGAPPRNVNGDNPSFARPVVDSAVKGGVVKRQIEETESRTGTPRRVKVLVLCLIFVVGVQPFLFLNWFSSNVPLDCATGNVTIVGSTAFRPVLEEAVHSYDGKCPDAHFAFATEGSQAGLGTLDRVGRTKPAKATDYVAFSDGPKDPGAYPRLIQRPIGFALFTLVANPNAGVDDLPRDEIRDLFVSGKYSNWKQLNGFNVPISIVDRGAGSGTRNTFQAHVLDGRVEQNYNSDDCQNRKPGTANRTVRCQLNSTDDVLDTVARTDGAIGYAELGAATARSDVRLVRIDGQEASLAGSEHGAYPFGETEYAYTYRQPGPDSLSASFLRFLTNKIGQDVIRNGGDRPCADLDNPVLCHPDGE